MNIDSEEFLDRMNGLIAAFDKAIIIIENYINKFEEGSENKILVKDLKNGSDIIRKFKINISNRPEWLLKQIITPSSKRPTLGLGKGFGEFLWHGYDWEREIMDAVHAADKYFRKM